MGRKRVGRVLDYLQPILAGKATNRVHVAGKAAKMDRHDRRAIRRVAARRVVKIDKVRFGLNINEHDLGAKIADPLAQWP
jgi:hypothetical protein